MKVVTNTPLIVEGRHVEAGTTIEMDDKIAKALGEAVSPVKAVKKDSKDEGSKDKSSKDPSAPASDASSTSDDESNDQDQEDPGLATTTINTDL